MAEMTFMGIPVEHDRIDKGYKSRVEQWDASKFYELVKPILEAGVLIRWDQYTPYFNDGDVCEFSVGSPRFSVGAPREDEDDYSDGFHDLREVQMKGGKETSRLDGWGRPVSEWYEEPTGVIYKRHPAYDAMAELEDAMDAFHFEDLLYETFGDHAQVTIRPDGITKESYDHD